MLERVHFCKTPKGLVGAGSSSNKTLPSGARCTHNKVYFALHRLASTSVSLHSAYYTQSHWPPLCSLAASVLVPTSGPLLFLFPLPGPLFITSQVWLLLILQVSAQMPPPQNVKNATSVYVYSTFHSLELPGFTYLLLCPLSSC